MDSLVEYYEISRDGNIDGSLDGIPLWWEEVTELEYSDRAIDVSTLVLCWGADMGISVGSSEGYKDDKLDVHTNCVMIWQWCDFDGTKYDKRDGLSMGVLFISADEIVLG